MPTVTLQSIDSFSSEDPNFPAANLLSKESTAARKWKCRDAGEKSAHVVFRLGQPVLINGIDIGNEHSAFVEVLVGKSGPSNVEFKEILLTSSFMSPIESRNSSNTGRVRCFTAKELVEPVAKERWDLVKVICTQPFNGRVQYGLAFVTLHSAGEKKGEKPLVPEAFQRKIQEEAAKKVESPKVLQLGRFKLREESPDSDEGSTSAAGLFARWKASRESGGTASQPAGKPAATPARPTSTAAAIRDASTPSAIRSSLASPAAVKIPKITSKTKPRLFDDDDEEDPKVKPLNRNRDALLYDKDDDKPNEKLERKLAEDRARKQREKDAKVEKEQKDRSFSEKKQNLHDTSSSKFKNFLFDEPSKEAPKKTTSVEKTTTENGEKDAPKKERSRDREKSPDERKKRPKESSSSSRERATSAAKEAKKPRLDEEQTEGPKKPVTYKPFNKLLERVVLVISGIQNPDRANLRNQALAMGAKYKSDWDSSCTHLICAFKNTPKYNQVHGHGKIVRKEWIERCHSLRKRLSWRKFALDSADEQRSDSEGEIVDEARRPKATTTPSKAPSPPPSAHRETDEEALAHYDLDDVTIVDDAPPTYELSGSDTEEEIERVRQKQRERFGKEKDNGTKDNGGGGGGGMYDKSTEEDENGGKERETELDFFKRKRFLLDEDVGAVDLIKLERYVELYKGTITKSATEADYWVTRNRKPLPASFKGELVKPLWIYECHDMECLIPTHRYKP